MSDQTKGMASDDKFNVNLLIQLTTLNLNVKRIADALERQEKNQITANVPPRPAGR